jgi:ferric-dicitrate binding protein FerR (iron transport regulator)
MTSKKDFERILERYLNGTATDEEKERIEKWYSTLESENNHPVLSAEEEEALDRSDLEIIQKRGKQKKFDIIALWPSLMAAAAVIIIGVVAIYNISTEDGSKYLTNTGKDETSLALTGEQIVNASGAVKMVMLADSSQVILQPNSTLWISVDFNKDVRRVALKGEAFFDVVRDERRPFKVFTHDVVTTVLGTSFTIKAPSDKETITVAVRSGRVAVSSKAERKGNTTAEEQEVIVTPNQQAVFNPQSKLLEATLVQHPVVLNKPEKAREVFDEEPIINILSKIEKVYGVHIEYDKPAFAGCRITTAFSKEGLYERLDILSKAIGATYVVEGTKIVFDSKEGCTTNQ